jgi:hypothetical protein
MRGAAIAAVVVFLLVAAPFTGAQDLASRWQAILDEVVTGDGVRYHLLDSHLEADFDSLLSLLATYDTAGIRTDADKIAFWVTAYNILFLERVRAAGMPRDISEHGFEAFFGVPLSVARMEMSLDQIEHVILRRQPGPDVIARLGVQSMDPRIHVVLNCGALSCPPLRRLALTPENLQGELEEAMDEFVNSDRHFRADEHGWSVSSLIDWFADDWDLHGPAGDFLVQYVREDRPAWRALTNLFAGRTAAEIVRQSGVRTRYDWRLNIAR